MFRQHFLQAWRRIFRDRKYAILNILGLSAGLTCFALISLWVSDEISYDRFNTNYDRIVRVVGTAKTSNGITESAVSSAPMAAALKKDYPEVENTVRIDMRQDIVVHDNKQTLQEGIMLTEPSFFKVFSYSLTRGDEVTALQEPFSVVLTTSTAKKYFGGADAMGQRLTIFLHDSTNRGVDYKVTGIMPDPPANAHFSFSMLASFKTIETVHPDVLTVDGWGDASYYTYLLLRPGTDQKSFSARISHFYEKYIGDRNNTWRSIYTYSVQPLADIHLRSHLQYELAANGSITQVYVFSLIGIIILLLAAINYTNLSTARSLARAREVGVKKLVGAGKLQLVMQYLTESVLHALIALVFALILSFYFQPYFEQLTGKQLSLFHAPALLVFMIGVSVFLGLISGIYPAFVLSSFKPVTVLKGAFRSSPKGVLLGRTLVVSQFVITLVLVGGIIIIYSQMNFIRHKDLGYNKDALISIGVNGNTDVISNYTAFKNELGANPLVHGFATSNALIVNGLGEGGAETVDAEGNPMQVNTARLKADPDYLGVYGLRLVAGNNFSINAAADPVRQVILNETAVKRFGWKNAATAIGKPFKMGEQRGTVVGVVNDFHFNSLQSKIEPLAIYPLQGRFSRITLNVDMTRPTESLAAIEKAWKKHFSAALFDFAFVDRQVEQQYLAENRFSKIFLYFSVLSLLIACLGLYGLIAYATSRKSREISIRKVLGASVHSLAVLLSKDFVKLVALACVIAIPVTIYIMHRWLEGFAYRIATAWWMFGLPVVLVLTIALITVSIHTIRAALVNPAKSLRIE